MARVLRRPMLVGDDKHEMQELQPGDTVPSWVPDDAVDEEWLEERTSGVAAGLDLIEDHTRNEMLRAAKRAGVEDKVKPTHSNEQIAAIIRHHLFEEDLEERFDVDTEDYKSSLDANVKLFDETNKTGNVNGGDADTKTKSRSSGSDG